MHAAHCRGVIWNWREVCCLRIPRRRPEPLLHPDLEMGYTDQEEAIPAISSSQPYYPGMLQAIYSDNVQTHHARALECAQTLLLHASI